MQGQNELEMNENLSVMDDFYVYFLIERQFFPIKISKVFNEKDNALIEYFSTVHVLNETESILELSKNKRITQELIQSFFKKYSCYLEMMQCVYTNDAIRKLFGWYLNLYRKDCYFDIASTSKYYPNSRECCIVSRMEISAGTMISNLRGLLCPIDEELICKLTEESKDFSIMYSQSNHCEGVFIGPARFVNHSCKPNCEVLDNVCLLRLVCFTW